MKGKSQQVSFRLAREHADELDQRAAAEGQSRGDYARNILIASLTESPLVETRNRVAEVQDELQRHREGFFKAVTALLVKAGDMSVDDATEWVKEKLM